MATHERDLDRTIMRMQWRQHAVQQLLQIRQVQSRFLCLANEVLIQIVFELTNFADLLSVFQTSRHLRKICNNLPGSYLLLLVRDFVQDDYCLGTIISKHFRVTISAWTKLHMWNLQRYREVMGRPRGLHTKHRCDYVMSLVQWDRVELETMVRLFWGTLWEIRMTVRAFVRGQLLGNIGRGE
ncbi:hypothetical protein BDD12DRAFT_896861 [Trichophaea hybrida]|nr:hypothetical protein BDD12DRAFT_896861 [Trichophaea hybrida]